MSRWMTWLPISLKNAAKCDKWYQLQNHSITESLNANGAREKPSTAIPVHAVSLSVEQKPKPSKESWLVYASLGFGLRRMRGRVVTPNPPSNRRFMGNAVLTPSSSLGEKKVSTSERTVKTFDHFVGENNPLLLQT